MLLLLLVLLLLLLLLVLTSLPPYIQFQEFHAAKKSRAIGLSNFKGTNLQVVLKMGGVLPAVNQVMLVLLLLMLMLAVLLTVLLMLLPVVPVLLLSPADACLL